MKRGDGGLAIVSTSNAAESLTSRQKPLLTWDMWEHAYYIDYWDARPKYMEASWRLVDWGFVARNLAI